MGSGTFLIVICLIAYVIYVLWVSNFWGTSRGTKKARSDVSQHKAQLRRSRRTVWLLSKVVALHHLIGFGLNESTESEYKYKLSRLRWRVKALDRELTPVELAGFLKAVQLFGVILSAVLFFLTYSPFSLIFLLLLFAPALFTVYANARIGDEDAKLELEFPDFFTVLYSRLMRGSNIRLAPTLRDYINSLDSVIHQSKSKRVMRNFVSDLRNNIEIYGDDSMAITKLRSKYRSAMIINFCNLTSQAISGVDNSDKLLSFKLELNSKRVAQMEKRAQSLLKRGSRAVLLIYVILFQFIALSWIAKLVIAGGLRSILGF